MAKSGPIETTPKSAMQRRLDEMHDHSGDAGAVTASQLAGYGNTGNPLANIPAKSPTSTKK